MTQYSAFSKLPIGSYGSTLLGKIFIGHITHAGEEGPFLLFQTVCVRSRSDDRRRKLRYLRAFSFCWVFKPHCSGVGKRGGQSGWSGAGVVGAAG